MRHFLSELGVSLSLLFGSGCGLITDDIAADLELDFNFKSNGTTFCNAISVVPAEYPEVRDNCSAIKEGTGKVRSIEVRLDKKDPINNISPPLEFGRGDFWMGETEFKPDDTCAPRPDIAKAFASFRDVHLVPGQSVTLELIPARRAQLERLIFSKDCAAPVHILMVGAGEPIDTGAKTQFTGKIIFHLDFVGSL